MPPPTDDAAADDLPPLSALGPAAVATAAIADEANGASPCAAQARQLLRRLQATLVAATQPPLRELGQALGTADPIAALHVMEADFGLEPDAPSAERLAAEASDADAARATTWPSAWRPRDAEPTDDVRTLLASGAIFGSGLVRTQLEYTRSTRGDDGGGHKRSRAELGTSPPELSTFAPDEPPPVRGGRGRVREENPLPRGKPNTSRPASKHVDDYTLGAKRFQNSSRAPSKHVDDYQSAPVVRKTNSIEGKGGGEGGDAAGQEPPPDGRTQSMGRGSMGDGGPPGGGPGGTGGGTGNGGGPGGGAGGNMSLQMLQQQLGMAAAHSLPPGMMGMQMPQHARPGMGGPMGMGGMMGAGMGGLMGGPMAGMMGAPGGNMAGVWRAPAMGGGTAGMGGMGGPNANQGPNGNQGPNQGNV